jgi:hypothetical protein
MFLNPRAQRRPIVPTAVNFAQTTIGSERILPMQAAAASSPQMHDVRAHT